MLKIIDEIEKTEPVETITVNGMEIWPVLNIYFANKLLNNLSSIQVSSKKLLFFFFKTFFYGFFNLFRKYDYLFFSSSDQRKKIEDLYVDKSIGFVADKLKKSLTIELAIPLHYQKIPDQPIVSKTILYFLIEIHSLFSRKPKIKNEQLLISILQKHHVSINYEKIIKKLIAQYKIGRIIAHIYKPKAVFFVCSYTNMGFIKAFKEQNIKVIELQHGVINANHIAYNIFKPFKRDFFPDYLFTFGLMEKEVFNSSNHFINQENVLPVGHYYLDYISSHYKGNKQLQQIIKDFRIVVAITADGLKSDKEVLKLIKETAVQDLSILYLYIPRIKFEKIEIDLTENIKVIDWLNCYEIIFHSTFHSTVYSTCAIEAPSIGVQNILINLNNLSKEHYQDILNDESITRFIRTPDEYLHAINTMPILDKNFIINSNRKNIIPNYQNEVIKALDKALKLNTVLK